MSVLKQRQKELRKLDLEEHKAMEALAISIANLEKLDNDQALDKRGRDRLKARKQSGKVYDEAELKRLNKEVRKRRDKISAIRKRRRRRRGWLAGIRVRIKRKRKQIRALARPRIIDLDLDFRPMAVQGYVGKVIGHYTAGPVDKDTQDAIRLCRMYHTAHLAQGWSGEAYHLCFTRDGNILILRPMRFVGAHTLGENTGSIGIMMHGTTGDKPTAAQKRALRWWSKNGHKKIMGQGRTSVRPDTLPFYGHNDFNATGCPGSFKPTYVSKGNK